MATRKYKDGVYQQGLFNATPVKRGPLHPQDEDHATEYRSPGKGWSRTECLMVGVLRELRGIKALLKAE
jgi:hypothetical protein